MKDKSFQILQNEAGLFTYLVRSECRQNVGTVLTCSSDKTQNWIDEILGLITLTYPQTRLPERKSCPMMRNNASVTKQ